MKKSPWAKLMMCSTPKSNASPAATSASDEPTTSPFSSWSRTWFITGTEAQFSYAVAATSRSALAKHCGGQLVGTIEVARPIGSHQDAAVHGVQARAEGSDQIKGRVHY